MNKIKSQLRRAFTIVELVIVIAVIAALAAVLIPTFVNVVKSANESNDMITVRNLNTILATNVNSINTPSDALAAVEAEGYSVDKMTPKSDGEIVYNAEEKQFIYIYEDGSTYLLTRR